MPQCCGDLNLMWVDDFEYPDTLASKGYTLISSVATSPQAGKGINASRGIEMNNGSGLGQFGTPTLKFPALCANRLAFGFGGYWKFGSVPGPGGFYFAEVRINVLTLISFYREEDAIVILGSDFSEIFRLANVFTDPTRFYKIEVAGQLNKTWGQSGAADGGITILVDDIAKVCLKNVTKLGSTFSSDIVTGWNNIAIGVHDVFDCLYVSNGWICGRGPGSGNTVPDTEDPSGPPSPGNGGPGGSFTSFDPLTPGLHTTHEPHLRVAGRPSDPVIIPPGGANPSFTVCTGGGTPPTGTDPTDPQTMTGIATPMVFLDFTLPDATVLRFAFDKQGTPAAKFRDGKIQSISPLQQTLSDYSGRMKSTTVRIVFEDTSRTFRGYVADATNRFLKNSTVTVYIESDVARRAGTSPLVLMQLIVKRWKPGPGFTFELECVDELSAKQSPISVDRPLPELSISDLFPEAADHLLPIPIPMYYGQYSDDDKWIENPKRTPYGIVPVIGPVREDHFGSSRGWLLFIVCMYASKKIDSWFASNLAHLEDGADVAQQSGSVRMDEETEGPDADFLIPGHSGWNDLVGSANYLDIVAADGSTVRVTAIYARHERATAHRENQTHISVNLCGIEATGDGTGNVIDEAGEVAFHFWNNIVLLGVRTGNWPAVPVDALGTPKVQRSGVVALNTLHTNRVPGTGYQVAWAIRERRSVRAYWEQFQQGTGVRVGRSRHQIVLFDADDEDPLTGLTKFGHHEMVPGSFAIDPASDEIINRITYVSGPEASTGRFSHGMRPMTNTASVADYGQTHPEPDVEVHPVRVPEVAQDVLSRRLFRMANEVLYGSFDTDAGGLDLALGEFISVTNEAGLGANGWIDEPVMVIGLTFHANSYLTTVHFEGVGLTIALECVYDPVEDDASSLIVGLESNGTAARVCSGG